MPSMWILGLRNVAKTGRSGEWQPGRPIRVQVLPGGDGVSVPLVRAVHPSHRDLLDVLLLYAHVGASDGDRDLPVERPVARDDLGEEGEGDWE